MTYSINSKLLLLIVTETNLTTSFLKIDSPELQWTLGILAGGDG
nr:hypothetical protein [uncultured Emticicia sp.]